jgi:hypothetical protein
MIHLNIILPSNPRSSKRSFSFTFSHQISICTSPVPHTCLHIDSQQSWSHPIHCNKFLPHLTYITYKFPNLNHMNPQNGCSMLLRNTVADFSQRICRHNPEDDIIKDFLLRSCLDRHELPNSYPKKWYFPPKHLLSNSYRTFSPSIKAAATPIWRLTSTQSRGFIFAAISHKPARCFTYPTSITSRQQYQLHFHD